MKWCWKSKEPVEPYDIEELKEICNKLRKPEVYSISIKDYLHTGVWKHTYTLGYVYKYKYYPICTSCDGTGSIDHKKYPFCDICRYNPINIFCDCCNGRRRQIPKDLICNDCKGFGFITDKFVELSTINTSISILGDDEYRLSPKIENDDVNHFEYKVDTRNVRCPPMLKHICYITPEEARKGFTRDIPVYDFDTLHIIQTTPVNNGDTFLTSCNIDGIPVFIQYKIKNADGTVAAQITKI